MINYHFNKEMQVLEVNYSGDISFNDLMEYGEMIKHNKSFPRDIKIITDASNANYLLSPYDVTAILDALKEHVKPYRTVKNAVFHNKPKETALSYLVDNDAPIPNYEHHIFSSREAALNWLIN